MKWDEFDEFIQSEEYERMSHYLEENHLGPYSDGIPEDPYDRYHDDDIYYDLDYQDHDDSGGGHSYDDYFDND